jgi:hypothetical protein
MGQSTSLRKKIRTKSISKEKEIPGNKIIFGIVLALFYNLMKAHYSKFVFALFLAFYAGVSFSQNKAVDKETEPVRIYSEEKNGIKITEANHSPEFPNAKISLKSPQTNEPLQPGKNIFVFGVENFQLGAQTTMEHMHCANSEKGQHIHYILDNSPYTAHYEPMVEKELQDGKFLLLAFLSRSYHESIKNGSAFLLTQLNVGNTKNAPDYDLNAPYLFYSRPKAEYKGEDTKRILLDFYLVNTQLSPTGNKVKLTVNGNEFILNKWVPYIVEGLPMGENKFRIQLIDKDNHLIDVPFSDSGERVITLLEK